MESATHTDETRSYRPGVDRTNAKYAWPTSLVSPPPGTRIIYLDLNHWISLAKAATGHPDGARHRATLTALREAGDRVVTPLALPHYMEMAGIADPRQRFDVAAVMEELSDFACLISEPTIVPLELDAALAATVGTHERFGPISLLGRGVLQALGLRGGLRFRTSDGRDVTAATRAGWSGGPEQFDAWTEQAERQLDRASLRGPTDSEVSGLAAAGWDPTVARRTAEVRATQEREQGERLAAEPRWRRGRLRDVVAARYLALEVLEMFNEALAAHDLRPTDVIAHTDTEAARRFTDSMPTADVRISLLTAGHRNPQTTWTSNAMFDIDALTVAVAYCDVVVTDKEAHHAVHAAGLHQRLNTTVLAKLDDLGPML